MKSTIAILLEIFLHFTQTHWNFERLLNRYVQMNQWINVRLEYSDEWVVYYRDKRYPVPFKKHIKI